ncbi:hypothetical protein [Halorussus marinus]|uniref:hypothetical protein n=1 Tax=Halorussus marinus TaxID=2505976 RepID=UPI001091C01E|nr:hypothetical protein [Halorussus marinus]
MTDDISRRRVLELGGAVLGGGFATGTTGADQAQFEAEIQGWVIRGDRTEITGRVSVVEAFQHRGMNLCNDGKVYRCRTCERVAFYLLVANGASEPTPGDRYRVESTGEESRCGNVRVRLRAGAECGDSGGTPENTSTRSDGDGPESQSTEEPETRSADGRTTTGDPEPPSTDDPETTTTDDPEPPSTTVEADSETAPAGEQADPATTDAAARTTPEPAPAPTSEATRLPTDTETTTDGD